MYVTGLEMIRELKSDRPTWENTSKNFIVTIISGHTSSRHLPWLIIIL